MREGAMYLLPDFPSGADARQVILRGDPRVAFRRDTLGDSPTSPDLARRRLVRDELPGHRVFDWCYSLRPGRSTFDDVGRLSRRT